jgi:AraC-like DNA-binding protein
MRASILEPTVPNHFVPALVSLALRFQLRPEQLFRRAGIDLDAVRAPGAGFSVREVEGLVEVLMRESGVPEIALLLGEKIDPESLGLFGQLIATSSSPREAMATFADFKLLLHPSFDLRVEEGESFDIARYASNDEVPIGDKAYYAEALLAAVMSLGEHFLGQRATPRRATFRHGPPAYVDVYRRIFRCPVAFGEPYDALFYPKGLLDRSMLGKSEAYHRALRAQAEGDLGRGGQLPVAQVRRVMHTRIADPDLDVGEVARVLGVSSRTLQRRLGEGPQSFRALRDEVRFQRAKEALCLGDANIDEIAMAVGYRDRSNFVRAFTRWTGQSPSHFRADAARGKVAAPAPPDARPRPAGGPAHRAPPSLGRRKAKVGAK